MKKLLLSLMLCVPAFIIIPHQQILAQSKAPVIHPTKAMSDDDMREIQRAMSQKSNDADKMQVFQVQLKDKGIMVHQIIALLNQYQLDQSKLNSAIFAYPYCVDYKNYMKIQDNFAEDRNKDLLKAYVKKNGGRTSP